MVALSGKKRTLSIYRSIVSFNPVGLGLLLAAAALKATHGSSPLTAGVLGLGTGAGLGVGLGTGFGVSLKKKFCKRLET